MTLTLILDPSTRHDLRSPHSLERPLHICVVASSRFPISEPFSGGLEAHTHGLVVALRARGHRVSLFAGPGSDPVLGAELLDVPQLPTSHGVRPDIGAPPELWSLQEHQAYLSLMLSLGERDDVDLVHNNSLHHLPIAMARSLRAPVVTTLHTPPLPWSESAAALAPGGSSFIAVSHATQRSWEHLISSTVVHNGVDTDFWTAGPGGGRAVWSGRIVPEKSPHLAIDAAVAADLPLCVYGPIGDPVYFREQIVPRLGPGVSFGGHLSRVQLRSQVQRAAVVLVTPSWEEPFGLVAAEAMSCGTPIAAFDRGALGELVDPDTGRLAPADDVMALAQAALEASRLPRDAVRRTACGRFGIAAMVDGYERVYAGLLQGSLA